MQMHGEVTCGRGNMVRSAKYCDFTADSPLYIFDGSFAEKRGSRSMRHDYSIPSLFSEDLMRLGGEHRRPPYRCACAT